MIEGYDMYFKKGVCSMESIFNVAEYFLTKEAMTHKKLQKLCYYAQAWYLANHGEPLVENRFEAWVHGPVSPDLYSKYKSWGWLPITSDAEREIQFNGKNTTRFLDLVYKVYGQYSGDELEAISHQEQPWLEARRGFPSSAYCRNPISQNRMKEYYGERLTKKNEH